LRYGLTAVFLQNVWVISASPPTNLPFWSLCYEFWYYVAFGVLVFTRERRTRILLFLAVLLIAGLEVILLSPCWIMGVALYLWRDRLPAPQSHRRIWFAVSLVTMLGVIAILPQWPYDLGRKGLWYSGAFVTDWITALAVSFCIRCFDTMESAAPPKIMHDCIRYFADHTFSLYLFHYPLVLFATAVLPIGDSTMLALSSFTEGKRGLWRAWFERRYDRLAISSEKPA
jgi:peptidoglycan/LPS O-acetylase OafA/YrhL